MIMMNYDELWWIMMNYDESWWIIVFSFGSTQFETLQLCKFLRGSDKSTIQSDASPFSPLTSHFFRPSWTGVSWANGFYGFWFDWWLAVLELAGWPTPCSRSSTHLGDAGLTNSMALAWFSKPVSGCLKSIRASNKKRTAKGRSTMVFPLVAWTNISPPWEHIVTHPSHSGFPRIVEHEIPILDTAKFAAIVGIGPKFGYNSVQPLGWTWHGMPPMSVMSVCSWCSRCSVGIFSEFFSEFFGNSVTGSPEAQEFHWNSTGHFGSLLQWPRPVEK